MKSLSHNAVVGEGSNGRYQRRRSYRKYSDFVLVWLKCTHPQEAITADIDASVAIAKMKETVGRKLTEMDVVLAGSSDVLHLIYRSIRQCIF